MSGDCLTERTSAKIDEFGGNPDKSGASESGWEPIPPARPQKATDHGRARQQSEDSGDGWQVNIRPIADQPRRFHKGGNKAGQQPRAHPELKLPRHQAVAVDEAVCGFEGLENFIAPIEARLDDDRYKPQTDRHGHQHNKPGNSEQSRRRPAIRYRARPCELWWAAKIDHV